MLTHIRGDPIAEGETPVYEEYVMRDAKQIVPLFIIGLQEVFHFVVWREEMSQDTIDVALCRLLQAKGVSSTMGLQNRRTTNTSHDQH